MKKKENCLLSSSKLQLQMYLPDLTDFYSLPKMIKCLPGKQNNLNLILNTVIDKGIGLDLQYIPQRRNVRGEWL